MKRCEEKMAVVASWPEPAPKFPVRAMRTSEYSRDRHMKTRSLRSLSIRFSSVSPSSRLSVESKPARYGDNEPERKSGRESADCVPLGECRNEKYLAWKLGGALAYMIAAPHQHTPTPGRHSRHTFVAPDLLDLVLLVIGELPHDVRESILGEFEEGRLLHSSSAA